MLRGLEPRISALKGPRVSQFHYSTIFLVEVARFELASVPVPKTGGVTSPQHLNIFFFFIVYILYTKIKEKSNFKWSPKPFYCWLALSCDQGGWILLCAPPYTPLSQLSWWDGQKSNLRDMDFQSIALPAELPSHMVSP